MVVGVGAELEFLHLYDVLLLLGLVLLLLLFVLPLAVVHRFGDWRFSGGGDQNEVQTQVLRLPDCCRSGHHLNRSVRKYGAHFAGSDGLVYILPNAGPAWG